MAITVRVPANAESRGAQARHTWPILSQHGHTLTSDHPPCNDGTL